MSAVLGFDFGTHSIGVCSGNPDTGTASPLPALKARDGIPDRHALRRLMEEWQPRVCVVGLPLNMDGSEQEMTRRARKFGNRLANDFRVKVAFEDERLTSAEAKAGIFEKGGFRALRDGKGRIDSASACLILEQYFEGGGGAL
ncbi:MAG: Holliday junction resolvase RuvX [Aeromonadales bacterium]|nr:Holliday junction resolvase RuvX [Aeromonadales bacterium]MDY2892089.1 Holliday junction resolvase RuvX [Succinivibrio sp.]